MKTSYFKTQTSKQHHLLFLKYMKFVILRTFANATSSVWQALPQNIYMVYVAHYLTFFMSLHESHLLNEVFFGPPV